MAYAPDQLDPTNPWATPDPTASPASAPTTAGVTYTPAGYLGQQPIFKGSDGKYYQQVGKAGQPGQFEYAEISGYAPDQVSSAPNLPMGRSGSSGSQGGAFAIDPSFLQAYTGQFAAPTDATLPQFQSPAGATLPAFQAPGEYKPPTAADLLKDPSYLFREGRITDQIQNSASARGVTNSGGTLDDIMAGIGNFAGLSYNALADRNLNVWGQDWNHALDTYGLQVGNANTMYGRAANEYGQQTTRANTAYGRALGEFQDARQQFYDNQTNPFNKLYAGASLGAQAAMA